MTMRKKKNKRMNDTNNLVTFRQNPEIDILFGYMGVTPPSKKQDFKPVKVSKIDEDGKEEVLKNFYVKKPSSQSVREFEALIRSEIGPDYQEKMIQKPDLVEVTISINLTKKRYYDIDVDNIAKTVLDSITGYLIEDDSQVKRVICQKDIHPLNMTGFFVSLTKLTEERKGLMGDYFLFSEEKK